MSLEFLVKFYDAQQGQMSILGDTYGLESIL